MGYIGQGIKGQLPTPPPTRFWRLSTRVEEAVMDYIGQTIEGRVHVSRKIQTILPEVLPDLNINQQLIRYPVRRKYETEKVILYFEFHESGETIIYDIYFKSFRMKEDCIIRENVDDNFFPLIRKYPESAHTFWRIKHNKRGIWICKKPDYIWHLVDRHLEGFPDQVRKIDFEISEAAEVRGIRNIFCEEKREAFSGIFDVPTFH